MVPLLFFYDTRTYHPGFEACEVKVGQCVFVYKALLQELVDLKKLAAQMCVQSLPLNNGS